MSLRSRTRVLDRRIDVRRSFRFHGPMAVETKTAPKTETTHEPAWRQHLPWVATLVAFAYAALKIALVSGGDPAVARALVTTSSLPTLLLGIAELALPMLVAVVAYISLLTIGASRATGTSITRPLAVA